MTTRTRTSREHSSWGLRLVATLPLYGALFLAFLGAVSTALALFGAFHGDIALPVAAVLTLLGIPVLGLGARTVTKQALVVDLLAIVLAAGFTVANARISSVNIVVGRDPGTYTVTAKWLVDHPSLDIDTHNTDFGPTGGVGFASAGFGVGKDPGHLYAQGAHVVPEILAVSGTFLGDRTMYRTDALIGGLALLAFYAFAWQVVGRWLALLSTALVGFSLPMLVFSRDNYTEPLSMLLVFGGLAMLWRAGRGQSLLWGLSGFVLAGSCLARIDAFLTLPPLVLYAALTAALAPRGERRVAGRDAAALLVGAAVPAVLGLRDLQVLSFGYYRDLHSQFSQIEKLVAAAVVVSVVLLVASLTGLVTRLDERSSAWRSTVANLGFGVIVVIGLALAARPLFGAEHASTGDGQKAFVASLQNGLKEHVDPTRTYAENSVTWQAWYIGPLATALSLFGIALLVRKVVRDRDLRLVPFLLFLLITAGLYLTVPSITPDQIWAMRRYVPVVIPGIALGAAYVVLLLLRRLPRPAALPAAVVLLALAFGPVLYVTKPLVNAKEDAGQLTEIHEVCDALPADAAVIAVGDLSVRYAQTLRSFCDVTVGTQATADQGRIALAEKTLAAQGRPLYVIAATMNRAPNDPVPAAAAQTEFSDITLRVLSRAFETPPHGTALSKRRLFLGEVGPDGTVTQWLRSPVDVPGLGNGT